VIGSEMAVPVRRPFDPVSFDLDANFRLTRFSDLKGLGCKVPRDGLNKMLEPLKEQEKSQLEAEQMHFQYVIPAPRIGQLIARDVINTCTLFLAQYCMLHLCKNGVWTI